MPTYSRLSPCLDRRAGRAAGTRTLERFVADRGLVICNYYIENESGARLNRPELFRLLADCSARRVVGRRWDRLSRLASADWENLKAHSSA